MRTEVDLIATAMIYSTTAPFSEYYYSTGANNCSVLSSGFAGNISNDIQNPVFIPSQTPVFMQTVLWDSNQQWGPLPPSYTFATFYFGGAPLAGSYEGYKWFLTCWNIYGDSKTAVMYGKPQ